MKIAFYTNTILEHGGGLENYFIHASSDLVSYFPNLQVDIITNNDEFSENLQRFLSIYYLQKIDRQYVHKVKREEIKKILHPKVMYYKVDSFKNLRKLLSKYDVIYAKNELVEAFILKFLVGYKNLPPIIFGCHTPIYYPLTSSLQSKLHNYLYNGIVYKFLASGVSGFHVLNPSDANRVKKLFPKVPVFQIPNYVDFDNFKKKAKQYIYRHNWDKSKFNILWVGRLTEQKGVDNLVKLIYEINDSKYRKRIMWNVVGDGPDMDFLRKKVGNYNNVKIFGHVNYNFMPNIYKNNDLFITTSRWETYGFNVIEALATGLLVVSYNIPGPNNVIVNGVNGFLVNNIRDFKNQIITLLKRKKSLNRKENEKKIKFIKKLLDKPIIINKLISMFNDVVKKQN